MSLGLFAGVVLAQLALPGAPARQQELFAAAAASPRPVECLSLATRAEDRVWKKARTPGLETHCDALARGYVRLRRDPALALEAATAAEKALPGRAAPHVLAGRALLALGRTQQAWARFEQARGIARRSIDAPVALHDFAVTALATGHSKQAVAAYRALVPRAGLLDGSLRRQRVYVEAATLIMSVSPGSLDEAIGYLTEARQRGTPPGFSAYVLGALALALDRQGQVQAARGALAEAGSPATIVEIALGTAPKPVTSMAIPALPPGEVHALIAVLAERHDVDLAREQWRAFLDSQAGKGPWADHARRKLAGLQAKRRGGP